MQSQFVSAACIVDATLMRHDDRRRKSGQTTLSTPELDRAGRQDVLGHQAGLVGEKSHDILWRSSGQ